MVVSARGNATGGAVDKQEACVALLKAYVHGSHLVPI
jgi:hypothetical protein